MWRFLIPLLISTYLISDSLDYCQQLTVMWGKDYQSQCSGFSISVLDMVGVQEGSCSCPGEYDDIVGNLIFIPAGDFLQGEPDNIPCPRTNAAQFSHTLTRNLLVMETEVSRRMWTDLEAAQINLPHDPTNQVVGITGPNNPVHSCNWFYAVLFANYLSLEQGLTPCYYLEDYYSTVVNSLNLDPDEPVFCNFSVSGYRLPTEGEWEYFARGGTTGIFPIWEPNYNSTSCSIQGCTSGVLPFLESISWFCPNRYDPIGDNTDKPVGMKNPNRWGLKDTIGNVREWCWDWYATNYPVGFATNDTGPMEGQVKILRGGTWQHIAQDCSSTARASQPPYTSLYLNGFRLVRTCP